MLLSSPRAHHGPPWAPEASLTSRLQSWRRISTFVPRSPGQERAAPCAQDVGFYELAGARNPWRVCVSCPHCLGEPGGHQEPDVVAAKHCQQLLGHFLEEAGKQSEGHEDTARAHGEAKRSSHPWAGKDAPWEEPGRALVWGSWKMPGLVWNPSSATAASVSLSLKWVT